MNAAVRAVARMALAKGCEPFAIREGYEGLVQGGKLIQKMSWEDVRGYLSEVRSPNIPSPRYIPSHPFVCCMAVLRCPGRYVNWHRPLRRIPRTTRPPPRSATPHRSRHRRPNHLRRRRLPDRRRPLPFRMALPRLRTRLHLQNHLRPSRPIQDPQYRRLGGQY